LGARETAAGTAMPARAASVGMRRRLRSVSSPIASSRRTSSPTTKKKKKKKKKNTMRPSWSRVIASSPRRSTRTVDQRSL